MVGLSWVEAVVLAQRSRDDWRALAVSITDVLLRLFIQTFVPPSIAVPLLQWAVENPLAQDRAEPMGGAGPALCWPRVLLLLVSPGGASRALVLVQPSGASRAQRAEPRRGVAYRNLRQAHGHAVVLRAAGLAWLPAGHRVRGAADQSAVPALAAHELDSATRAAGVDPQHPLGAYRAERAEVPCRSGLIEPVTSYNPLRLELGPWLRLWRDLHRARGWRAVLGTLVMPPGWKPDGAGDTVEELRARALLQDVS